MKRNHDWGADRCAEYPVKAISVAAPHDAPGPANVSYGSTPFYRSLSFGPSSLCPLTRGAVRRRAGPWQLSGLERRIGFIYYPAMDDIPAHIPAPAGWLEVLEESEAELAAGLRVSGDVVRQMLRDSLARLEAARDAAPPRRAPSRR